MVTKDGKLQPNTAKAVDSFIDPIKTERKRKAHRDKVLNAETDPDRIAPQDLSPELRKAVKGLGKWKKQAQETTDSASGSDVEMGEEEIAEITRCVRELREGGGLSPAEVAALEYLEGRASRKDLTDKYGVTSDAIRSAELRVIDDLRKCLRLAS